MSTGIDRVDPEAIQLAGFIYRWLRENRGAMVVGAADTRRTAIDGEFDLTSLAAAIRNCLSKPPPL